MMRVLDHGKVVAEIPNAALTDDAPVYKRPLARWEPPVDREMPEGIHLGESTSSRRNSSAFWRAQIYVRSVGSGSNMTTWCRPTRSKLPERAMPASSASKAPAAASPWRSMATAVGAISIRASEPCTPWPKQRAKWLALERLPSALPTASTSAILKSRTSCGSFHRSIDGITKACEELDTPITGGNVSFYNETLGEGIYPTPVIGVVGILEDVHKAAKMHFAPDGVVRKIVLLRANEPGDAIDAESEFGSSEYAKEILGAVWGYPPELDIEKEATLQRALIEIIQAGLVESAHDCADGGLAGALVESALPAGVGATVTLPRAQTALEYVLFGEDASRVVISCDPIHLPRIQQVATEYGVFADVLGDTQLGEMGSDRIEIAVDGQPVISASIAELRETYEGALENALSVEAALKA